ncbi:MAG: rRNA maturation RNase YbeY [Mariniblastus sp.]|nr:rRNA maturation RNase YbeY [Mariniblastus sp.]
MPGSNIPTNNLPDPDNQQPPPIEVSNQQALPVDVQRLEKVAVQILNDHHYFETEISLAIVDDETIHDLNARFLEHDYETDVLSFVFERESGRLSGEVIVSADTAKRVADEMNSDYSIELLLYVVHGILHLVGYDDKMPKDRQSMRLKERHYMDSAGADYQPPDELDSPTSDEVQE